MAGTAQPSVLKSAGYDNPAYVTRQSAFFVRAAGAAAASAKYVAHAALLAYALSVNTTVAGTSTYTYAGVNGSNTVAVAADQVSLYVITNTASPGATVALATSTYGPYPVTGSFLTAGTYTNQVGAFTQMQINGTASGTAALGGVLIPAGSLFYVQGGTDATATTAVTVDYNIQPLAAVPA